MVGKKGFIGLKVEFSYLGRQFIQLDEDNNKSLTDYIFDDLKEFIKTGDFTLGKKLEEFEEKFFDFIGVKHAIGVNSGTDALILSLKALGIGFGDEVITCAETFIATAGAIAATGAKPVFVDVNDEFTIDVDIIEPAITKKTKAIMPVWFTGNAPNMNKILDIKNLSVDFDGFKAVLDVDLSLDKGKTLGIVGESGSGKSVTQLALMGLIPYPGIIKADRLVFNGHDLLAMSKKKKRQITGKEIAMIFQEPMSSLNPCFTVEFQLTETLKIHEGGSRRQRRERAVELLKQVGIPAPEDRMKSFPHQLSGGISQRVMIAMAIACSPKLLIADEPTTALDVTIQAQILDLLISLQREKNMALILITHDLGVIAENCDDVAVMYAGKIVENAGVRDLFHYPLHPYTKGLLASIPSRAQRPKTMLPTISGHVPSLMNMPEGCRFQSRCPLCADICKRVDPEERIMGQNHGVKCHMADEQGR